MAGQHTRRLQRCRRCAEPCVPLPCVGQRCMLVDHSKFDRKAHRPAHHGSAKAERHLRRHLHKTDHLGRWQRVIRAYSVAQLPRVISGLNRHACSASRAIFIVNSQSHSVKLIIATCQRHEARCKKAYHTTPAAAVYTSKPCDESGYS